MSSQSSMTGQVDTGSVSSRLMWWLMVASESWWQLWHTCEGLEQWWGLGAPGHCEKGAEGSTRARAGLNTSPCKPCKAGNHVTLSKDCLCLSSALSMGREDKNDPRCSLQRK